MDNLQYIKHHQRPCCFFPIFNITFLYAVILLLWKKTLSPVLFKIITLSIQSSLSGFSLYEGQDVRLREGLTQRGGLFLQPQILNYLLQLDITSTIELSPKVSNDFSKNFIRNVTCGTHLWLHNQNLFQKPRRN